VVFFTLAESAEQAGFRACLRCRPVDSQRDDQHRELVERICQAIESRLDEEGTVTLDDLSAQVHISPYHLQRTFKRIMGITPRQYAEARRLERLKVRLKRDDNVSSAMYDAGYGSSSRLYERTDDHLGMTPSAYRKGGPQASIGYTIADCSLGKLLVAATERGICAVSLGDSDEALQAGLLAEYPAAEVYRDDTRLSSWVSAILDHLQGAQPHLDLPLDVKATAFQWRVWRELQSIPLGKTYSYSQVAAAIGQPRATRAVARACATNPAALVIPCHRVVRENGSLGGYRWGVERKQALLAQEQQGL
jgi:AraC family transcriptional regulator of adaptative response/methylated-DNA-[protein]-cysteine methyltransferase